MVCMTNDAARQSSCQSSLDASDSLLSRVYLDVTLRPHRSLSKFGFLLVMSAIAGTGMLIGTLFFLAGAWPVLGFCGLEILLVYVAFKMNYRDARHAEHLRLTDRGLEILWERPNGYKTGVQWEPNWLSINLQERAQDNNRLTLRCQGKTVEIGRFLLPGERAELAEVIRDAVQRYRTVSP